MEHEWRDGVFAYLVRAPKANTDDPPSILWGHGLAAHLPLDAPSGGVQQDVLAREILRLAGEDAKKDERIAELEEHAQLLRERLTGDLEAQARAIAEARDRQGPTIPVDLRGARIAALEKKGEILQARLDSLLCPGHRDKAVRDECLLCALEAATATAEEGQEIEAEVMAALAVLVGEDLKPCAAGCPGHLGPKAMKAFKEALGRWQDTVRVEQQLAEENARLRGVLGAIRVAALAALRGDVLFLIPLANSSAPPMDSVEREIAAAEGRED